VQRLVAAERLLGTARADVAAGVAKAAMIELDGTADKQSMRTMNLGAGAIRGAISPTHNLIWKRSKAWTLSR
jgi:hypothetical protein